VKTIKDFVKENKARIIVERKEEKTVNNHKNIFL